MTQHPICCTPQSTLEAAACLMVDCDCGGIPVVGDLLSKVPVGFVTDRDIVARAVATGRSRDTFVEEIMSTPAHAMSEDAELDECLALMEDKQIRRLLVVDREGRLTGIVAQADIAQRASQREAGELVERVSRPTEPLSPEAHRFVRYHE